MNKNQYAYPEVLVSTQWATDHLKDPNIRFVEVDVDTGAYDSGHLPGAVGWNWQCDTQDQLLRDIPNVHDFEALMSRSGIDSDTTVVLYGDNNNWFAAFAYWLLKMYGHADVRLIDGGRKKLLAENYPLTTEMPQIKTTQYKVQAGDYSLRALRQDVLAHLINPGGALVDVRSPDEFSGKLLAPPALPQEGSQRGGHIPGAVNIVWARAVNEDGTFKSYTELMELYGSQAVTADKDIIAYCRIGERSSHTWFVLKYLLGYPKVRNYDGSWTEWGSSIGMPIER
jgi:thiosulfate/3-mercaptopyruvate sulfurtransferase